MISVLLRVLYLFDAQIVSDSCIELDTSENPFKLVSVSTSVLYVPSDVLDLLYSSHSFPGVSVCKTVW